jgi:hypothetical protein
MYSLERVYRDLQDETIIPSRRSRTKDIFNTEGEKSFHAKDLPEKALTTVQVMFSLKRSSRGDITLEIIVAI